MLRCENDGLVGSTWSATLDCVERGEDERAVFLLG